MQIIKIIYEGQSKRNAKRSLSDAIKEINTLKQELFEIKKLIREKNNGILHQ